MFSKLRAPRLSEFTPVTALTTLDKTGAQRKSEETKPTQDKSRPHKVLTGWLLGVATLVGGAVVFLPRPIVMQGDPVDPQNPFSAPFTVTNASTVPLTHVDISLTIGEVATEPFTIDPNRQIDWTNPKRRSEIAHVNWRGHYLAMDDRYTITPSDVFGLGQGARLGGATIAVNVDYRPMWLPWKREKVFRFNTRKQTNGQFYWYSVPLE